MRVAIYDTLGLQCLGSTEVSADDLRKTTPWKVRVPIHPTHPDHVDLALEGVRMFLPDDSQQRRPARAWVAIGADLASSAWLRFARFPETKEPPADVPPQHRPWVARQIRAALGMEGTT